MVYDCFTFFNELDLLEIRMNALNEVVDKFVISEATFTHQGKPKPLHYEQNKQRYAAFHHKIIHIVVDNPPPNKDGSAWVFEKYQRQMLAKGLEQCKPDDVIMISDLDEIPNPDKINTYKGVRGIKIFRQKMYYYFINCINASNSGNYRWNGTIMVFYKDMESPQALRNIITDYIGITSNERWVLRLYCRVRFFFKSFFKWKKITLIEDGGWHFSYLGGVEMIIKKVEAFAHAEYNNDTYKNAAAIEDAINNGKDIFGRSFNYKFVPIDESFPKYIVEHIADYKKLVKQ